MLKRQIIGLIGVVLLGVGVFSPVFLTPISTGLNFIEYAETEAYIVLALAISSLFFLLIQKFYLLGLTGLLAILLPGFSLAQHFMAVNRTGAELLNMLAKTPLTTVNPLIAKSLTLHWGWLLIFSGSIFLIASATMRK